MMKKLLAGCLIVGALGAVVLGVGAFLLYRAASPLIDDARSYVRGLAELAALDVEIKNRTPHAPPASGELTDTQVERFVRVQEHVRTSLGQRLKDLEEKYRHLSAPADAAPPPIGELTAAIGELAGVLAQARRAQVEALNREGFSQDEYSWVRGRVLQAAGSALTSSVDWQKLETAIREGTGADFTTDLPQIDVPARNRELVKPLVSRMPEWLPLVFFGL